MEEAAWRKSSTTGLHYSNQSLIFLQVCCRYTKFKLKNDRAKFKEDELTHSEPGRVTTRRLITAADPACRLALVKGQPRPHQAIHLLINAYGFGGNNISLVLGGAHA